MKKGRFDAAEFFKTIIIYSLVFSMLSIAGIYINERQNSGKSETEEIPWEKRRIIESGGIIPSAIQINPNHVSPLKIVITADSKSVAAVYNPKLVWEIYRDFTDIILALFGDYFECEVLESDIADEYWKKSVDSADSIYIKYAGEHIYPVIYSFLVQGGDPADPAGMDYEYNHTVEKTFARIHELFIIPGSDGENFYGIAKDKDGNVSLFKLKSANSDSYRSYPNYETYEISRMEMYRNFIDRIDFAAYNNTVGIVPCKFMGNNEIWQETGFNKNSIKNLRLTEDFILYDDYTYSSVLSFTNPVSAEYNTLEAKSGNKIKELEIISRILKIFGYNTESADFYSIEENGKAGKKFTENHGSLTVFEDGQIFFHYASAIADNTANTGAGSEPGGVHLSNFLGYDTNYYTFYEKIRAGSIFAKSLAPEIAGSESDFDLYLTDVEYGNDRLKLIFSYYYGGMEIRAGSSGMGMYIVISRDAVVGAGIDALGVTSARTEKNKNLKQTTVLNYIENELFSTGNGDNGNIWEDSAEDMSFEGSAGGIEYNLEKEKFIIKGTDLVYNIENVRNKQVSASWVIY